MIELIDIISVWSMIWNYTLYSFKQIFNKKPDEWITIPFDYDGYPSTDDIEVYIDEEIDGEWYCVVRDINGDEIRRSKLD